MSDPTGAGSGWGVARPWVLSAVIVCLGVSGVVLPPRAGLAGWLSPTTSSSGSPGGTAVGGGPGSGASATPPPAAGGSAPGPTSAAAAAAAEGEYDMFALPSVAPLAQPLTAAEASWPLPSYCRTALARRSGDPQLSAMFLLTPQKNYQGTISGAYVVADGSLGADATPGKPPPVAHRKECLTRLWAVVATVYPQYALKIIKGVVVYVPTIDKAHPVEYVGYISPEDASLVDWSLGLAASSLEDRDLAFTMVHELGHLLSLAVSQVDLQKLTYSCPMLPAPDGCLNDKALLTSYLAATWKQETYRSWLTLWGEEKGDRKAPTEAARHTWYLAHRNEFVDEYATTNPREDFAESFASWCLEWPVRSGARAKLAFFDGRPELAAMKQRCAALT